MLSDNIVADFFTRATVSLSKVNNSRALYILWGGALEQSFGMEWWTGVESVFGVAKGLVLSELAAKAH